MGGDHVQRIKRNEEIDWDLKPGTIYFAQEFVHCLSIGEIRVGIVDGCRVVFRVFTQAPEPNSSDAGDVGGSGAGADADGWQYFPWNAPTSLTTLL